MNMDVFMEKLLAAAKEAGITAAEVFYQDSDRFSARAMEGEITQYQVSSSQGLSLRGTIGGKMGYSSTQAFDDAAIAQLVEGVKESASLVEGEEQDEIFAGDKEYPKLEKPASDIADITSEEKLEACLLLEKAAKEADPRVWKNDGAALTTATGTIRLKNSYGLDLCDSDSVYFAYVSPIVKDGDSTAVGMKYAVGTEFRKLDAAAVGRAATENGISQLHGTPVAAGKYRVIIEKDAMCDLLSTFCGIFSAENAQKNLSLLAGKEGTTIASPIVTLMDDPLLKGGFASCPFDAEGSAARTKAVIDGGVLTTLLHSRKTARKAGVQTTGNASRGSYAAPVHVAPTNFFFKPGEKTLDAMAEAMNDGLVITELSGLHAGANPVSGDFSLLSKGYTIEGGKRGHAVEQITVAGNFYDLLKNIRAIGSDLVFPGAGIGSPSVDVGELQVSGK